MRPVTRVVHVDVDMARTALFPEANILPAHPHLGRPVLIYTAQNATWHETTEQQP
jgi:hypothetical protein